MKSFRIALMAMLCIGTASLFAQNVKIDYRLDTTGKSSGYFNWTLGHEKTVKDSFDAASGASLAGTTSNFNVVRYDSLKTKKQAVPAGLRYVLLFPMSAKTQLDHDAFTVSEQGKAITIRFVHRDSAFEIKSDASGQLNLANGFKKALHVADNNNNVFTLKSDFVKAGADSSVMSSFDWSKALLVSDTKDSDASRYYDGKLDCAFKDGILTIKGTLVEKK